VSVISSVTQEGSRHLRLVLDGQFAFVHWRRATLVASLAVCFVLLVFGCKASLFHPGSHVRCRVARIEVSIVLSKRSNVASGARCQNQPASGVEIFVARSGRFVRYHPSAAQSPISAIHNSVLNSPARHIAAALPC
jgi:hypothetical protein